MVKITSIASLFFLFVSIHLSTQKKDIKTAVSKGYKYSSKKYTKLYGGIATKKYNNADLNKHLYKQGYVQISRSEGYYVDKFYFLEPYEKKRQEKEFLKKTKLIEKFIDLTREEFARMNLNEAIKIGLVKVKNGGTFYYTDKLACVKTDKATFSIDLDYKGALDDLARGNSDSVFILYEKTHLYHRNNYKGQMANFKPHGIGKYFFSKLSGNYSILTGKWKHGINFEGRIKTHFQLSGDVKTYKGNATLLNNNKLKYGNGVLYCYNKYKDEVDRIYKITNGEKILVEGEEPPSFLDSFLNLLNGGYPVSNSNNENQNNSRCYELDSKKNFEYNDNNGIEQLGIGYKINCYDNGLEYGPYYINYFPTKSKSGIILTSIHQPGYYRDEPGSKYFDSWEKAAKYYCNCD